MATAADVETMRARIAGVDEVIRSSRAARAILAAQLRRMERELAKPPHVKSVKVYPKPGPKPGPKPRKPEPVPRSPEIARVNGKRGGRPPQVERDFADVARIANQARARNKMAAQAVMEHYGVTYANAKNMIAQARRAGHEITPGPMGGHGGSSVMTEYAPSMGDRVVACAGCDFVRPAARRVELVAHCRTEHGRAASRHELVVATWPVEA